MAQAYFQISIFPLFVFLYEYFLKSFFFFKFAYDV